MKMRHTQNKSFGDKEKMAPKCFLPLLLDFPFLREPVRLTRTGKQHCWFANVATNAKVSVRLNVQNVQVVLSLFITGTFMKGLSQSLLDHDAMYETIYEGALGKGN